MMDGIKRKYIVDENKNKAVQIDIADFEKIERILEDYALGQLMKENSSAEDMTLEEAKLYYNKLGKEGENPDQ